MARADTPSTNSATLDSIASGESELSDVGSPRAQQRDREGASEAGNEGGIVSRIKASAAAQLASQKNRGIDALGSVVQAVRTTTNTLRDEKHDTIAGYADQAAGHIERWSQRMREKDIDELIDDLHRLGRRQPAVFIGSAFAIGLLAARFLKSSRPQRTYAGRSETRRSQYRGEARIDTVHDAGSRRLAGDYPRGDAADSGASDMTARPVPTAASPERDRGTRTAGARRGPTRTEKS